MADETVELEIKAIVDNAVAGLKKVQDGITGVSKPTNEMADQSKNLTSTLGGLSQQIVGLDLSTVGLFGSVGLAVEGIKKAINTTVEYSNKIDDLSRLTGIQVEEMSRLVMGADDVRLSTESLKTALTAATRQGIDVSIAGLESLSAKYLTLNPNVERGEFLLKTFGRSGADMGKLMELGADGIKKLMDGVSAANVLTPEAIKRTNEYQRNMDELNDTMQGVAITITGPLLDAINALKNTEDQESNFAENNRTKRIEAIKSMIDQGTATKLMVEEYQKYLDLIKDNSLQDSWVGIWKNNASVIKETIDPLDAVKAKLDGLNNISLNFGDTIANEFKKLEYYGLGADINQKSFDNVQKAMAEGKLSLDEFEAALLDMDASAAQIAISAGDQTAWGAAGEMAKKFKIPLQEALDLVKGVKQNLWDMNGMTVQSYINIVTTQYQNNVGGGNAKAMASWAARYAAEADYYKNNNP